MRDKYMIICDLILGGSCSEFWVGRKLYDRDCALASVPALDAKYWKHFGRIAMKWSFRVVPLSIYT